MKELNENELLAIIKPLVYEALKQKFCPNQIVFRFDEMTLHTVMEDVAANPDYATLSESNNWILRRSSWEINNYDRFLDIIQETPRSNKGFLTFHGMNEISTDDWVTYTLKKYDVAFALHYLDHGQVDICNLVNNTDVQAERENDPSLLLRGIASEVLTFAKMEGGTQMDNYRGLNGSNGFLGDKYRSMGFDKQTYQVQFDPAYQPEDDEWKFDTEKYGTPDIEGLERSKHRMRYNNPTRGYKQKFDDRMNQKFNIK